LRKFSASCGSGSGEPRRLREGLLFSSLRESEIPGLMKPNRRGPENQMRGIVNLSPPAAGGRSRGGHRRSNARRILDPTHNLRTDGEPSMTEANNEAIRRALKKLASNSLTKMTAARACGCGRRGGRGSEALLQTSLVRRERQNRLVIQTAGAMSHTRRKRKLSEGI
jgi:hypothetical protein